MNSRRSDEVQDEALTAQINASLEGVDQGDDAEFRQAAAAETFRRELQPPRSTGPSAAVLLEHWARVPVIDLDELRADLDDVSDPNL